MSAFIPPPGYDPKWTPPPGYNPYANTPPSEKSTKPPEDEYDIGGGGGGDTPPATETSEKSVGGTGFTQPTAENPDNLPNGNDRKISFVNDGTEPMTLKFTPGAGEAAMPDMVIPPGQSSTVQFPEGWSGNVRSTKGDGPATLLELTFDKDKTWANVSHIDGSNAGMTIQNPGDPVKTGKMTNLLDGAPDSLLAKDAEGKAYGIKASTVNNVTDQNVVDYLGSKIPVGAGYKYPTDDLSTTSFPTSNMVVHMANYV